jgi:hypothetical protein
VDSTEDVSVDGIPWKEVLVAAVSSAITGLGGLVLWLANYPKWRADLSKTQAETRKLEVEVDELTSTRFLRELDRLAEINDEQSALIEQQRTEIAHLRVSVMEYAEKERGHAVENAALRHRIEELELRPDPTLVIPTVALRTVFPPDIKHTPNENDGPQDPKDGG